MPPGESADGSAPPVIEPPVKEPPDSAGRSLAHAIKWLVADLLSTFVFVGVYAATDSTILAAAVGIGLGVGQIAFLTWRGRGIDAMQWMSLVLVVAFGGAAMLTRNATFIMLKPSLVYIALGAVMLKPGWMNRYAPPIARRHASDVMTAFGFGWAALMFLTAALNLAIALLASATVWFWYIGIFPIGSKLALFVAQFVIMRQVIRRRIRAAKALAAAPT